MIRGADIRPARISAELTVKCPGVVDLPDRDLNLPEAARLWSQDRVRLGACSRRHNALVDAVKVTGR